MDVKMENRIKYLRKRALERATGVPMRLRDAEKKDVWFWKPEWYWGNRDSFLPFFLGHDEYSRRTLVVGLPVTGRIVFALGYCGDEECYAESLEYLDFLNEGETV